MSNQTKSVGEMIRELRTEKNIPLRKLAHALDIDQSTLAKMEKNQRPFSLSMAPVLAKELGLNFKELQISLLSALVLQEVGDEEFVKEGLQHAVQHLQKTK